VSNDSIGDAAVPAPTEPTEGDVVAGRYRIDATIGEGGMGRVYGGENLGTGKGVALKCLIRGSDAGGDALLRFKREAKAAGRIDHPNVIQVYDVVDDGPYTFLVMERLRGEPLSSLMKREQKMTFLDATAITIEALRGLAAAHDRGVIHRDIKPENIFLCRTGSSARVKVLDFGVSKLAEGDELHTTRTGTVVGTPYYMAPEQVRAVPDLDHRIDIYALGAVLYHMLAGRTPFTASSLPALAVQIATEPVVPIEELRPEIDAELAAAIGTAMARDREARFQDAESFAAALEPHAGGVRFRPSGPEWTGRISTDSSPPPAELGHSSTVRAVSTQHATVAVTARRARWWLWLVLALLATAAAAWWMRSERDPTEAIAPPPTATDPPETERPEAVVPPALHEPTPAAPPTADVPEPVEAASVRERAPRPRRARSQSERPSTAETTETAMHRAGMLSVDDF
jgi:serine/threonine-protein kinase